MPPRSSTSARILLDLLQPLRQRPVCDCVHTRYLNRRLPRQSRHVSTVPSQFSEMEIDPESPPRWSRTPPAMKAPVRSRPTKADVKLHPINADPRKLDVYINFLGRGGDKMLSEETKWLAVTNKSFDHGRRGFNDRLAFFGGCDFASSCEVAMLTDTTGKRILELQCSLGLLTTVESSYFLKDNDRDPHGREPFRHPATESIECLSGGAHDWFTHHKQLSNLAARYGIPGIVRWVPKDVCERSFLVLPFPRC